MSEPAKYRVKATVEAMLYTGGDQSAQDVAAWVNSQGGTAVARDGILTILGFTFAVPAGDWVVLGESTFSLCQPDRFQRIYEKVEA